MESDADCGIREFASRIGRSPAWVSKLATEGKIPKNVFGKIPLREGLAAVRRIEAEKTIRSTKNKDAGVGLQLADELDVQKAVNMSAAMKKAQLATQVATAKLKDLEYKKQSGEYVSVDEVKADAREVASKLRAFCIAAPTRYAGLLENRTQREAEEVLRKLFSEFLTSIHDGRFFDNDFKFSLEGST